MKKLANLCFGLGLILMSQALAGEVRYFRITSPSATAITSVAPDGTVTWTNAQNGGTCTFQTTTNVSGGSNWTDYVQFPVSNPVVTTRLFDPSPPAGMALIPGGSFTMGATTNMGHESYSGETPQHTVYVSAFYMDRYNVTKALWDEVYMWATKNGYSFDYNDSGQGKAANHPAQMMTWYDAVKWCNARSEKESKTPAYYADAGFSVRYRSGQASPYVNWSSGYRLPTEAEWEKAARGGSSGQRFPWGNTISWSQANYYANPSGYAYDVNSTNGFHLTFNDGVIPYTSPMGYFAPNGYGLYDMAGNVWEWCWDWYSGTYYSSSPLTDPRGPASGTNRVYRGGGYGSNAIGCRSAYRSSFRDPSYRNGMMGFRSVLPLGQ